MKAPSICDFRFAIGDSQMTFDHRLARAIREPQSQSTVLDPSSPVVFLNRKSQI
jgi:hypothetical protein